MKDRWWRSPPVIQWNRLKGLRRAEFNLSGSVRNTVYRMNKDDTPFTQTIPDTELGNEDQFCLVCLRMFCELYVYQCVKVFPNNIPIDFQIFLLIYNRPRKQDHWIFINMHFDTLALRKRILQRLFREKKELRFVKQNQIIS